MDKTQQGHVNASLENGLATIEFFHPSHNSLPSMLLGKLADTIMSYGAMDEVIIILLKSAGDRTFCAGASFDELVAIEDERSGKQFFMGFANAINAIRQSGKIVIGRVQGKAVGGAVGLASAVDYCFATEYASVKLSELAVGIGPFVIGPAVQRKVGLSAFSQMALAATEWHTAAWAQERGLFQKIYPSIEEMDQALEGFIDTLLSMNPQALNQLKLVFWEGTDAWDVILEERAQMSGRLVLSKFSKETIAGFLKK
jgi:methylglutaconyl-CoA hydratase